MRVRKKHSVFFRSLILSLAAVLNLAGCANDSDDGQSGVMPAANSALSSITIPMPESLKPFLGPGKIDSLQLKVVPRLCVSGVVGTTVDRFVPNFVSTSETIASTRLKKGCSYALSLSFGRANASASGFEKIYLTNDSPETVTSLEITKSSSEKVTVLVRLYPTNDGKAELGLPGTPISVDATSDSNPSPIAADQTDLLPTSPLGQQNQQTSGLNWKLVLMASDQGNKSTWIPAFDNARNAVREFFVSRGISVSNIRQLSLKPQHQNQQVQAASVQSFTTSVSGLNAVNGNDACLVFLTSHGSRDGFNIGSSRLSPSAFGSALDKGCGSRPTVVLVSACYSGLYALDSSNLKKPNRVILTASRSDRTSFGCSPENQYTYWDGCLIDHLPKSSTFKDLAGRIQACINSKEAGMPTPSIPQTFIGSEVENLKIPGAF